MNSNIKNRQQAEKIIDRNVENLSDIQQLAVTKIAKAFRFGCNWGFLQKGEDLFAEKVEAIRVEPATNGLATSNGAIVLADENWLIATVNSVIPALDFNFVTKATERKAQERELFKKHIERALKGKAKMVTTDATGIKMALGLYSTNDTNTITSNGNEYPAFKLNIEEAVFIALEVLAQQGLTLAAYAKVKGQDVKPVYVREHYMQRQENALKDLVRASHIFDTLTGVHFEFWIVRG